MKKRIPALLLSLVMCLSLLPAGVFAAAEQDMPSDWSKEAMEAAVENGLFQGDDLGNLNPKDLLTRAQMAAVITRAFGAAKQADLSAYADMDSGKWYYEAVSKAAHMGIMGGDGRYMSPDRDITRQEAFTVLARAMKLPAGDPAVLKSFQDADAVADWAAGSMAAMVAAGYVGGSNGMLNPAGSITREEFAQVMFNIFGTYCTQAGTYTEAPVRSVMVNVPDVTLKNITVPGDIVIGDGVGDGDVILDHVNVEGRLVVRGGGVNSVHIIGGEQAWQVVIAKVDGNVRVVADEGTKVETITVEDGLDTVVIEGNVATLEIPAEGVSVELRNAAVDKLHVIAPEVSVTMTGKTEVNFLTVFEAAKGSSVTGEKDTTISNVIADTDVTVAGEVKVEKIEGSGAVTDESGEAVKETPGQTPVYVPPYTPPAHTHTWMDGAILTPATCAAEGSKEQTCSGCGAAQTAVITKLPHTEEEIPAVEPTCTVGGLTAGKRCTVCQTVTQAQEPVDALGHDWGEGEVTTEATCAAAGTKTFTCSRCQETRTETIPMIEHTWVAGESVENETCGGSTTTSTCSVCGATKTESTGEATHTPAEAVRENEIPATCAAGGSYDEVVKCSACQAELSREHKTTEKTTDHTEDIDPAVEPTCTGTGKTEGKHCSVCGEVIVAQTILPAAGHTFAEEWTSDGDNHWHAATCEHTDETKDKAAHNWNAGVVTTEPTCETAGVKTFTCTVCAATKTEDVAALGHDPAAEWTSDDTNHWHTCSRCDEKLDNAAHTEVIDAAVEPTCGTAGKTEGKHCSVCGKILVAQEPISATENHTYGDDWTSVDANGHKRTCSVCGKVETGAHSFGEDNICDLCGYEKPSTPGTQVPASAGIEKIEATSNRLVVTAFKPTDATGIRSFQIYMYDSQHESDSGFWFDRDPSGSDPNWNVFNIYADSFKAGYHYDKVRLTCWPKDGYEKAEWNGDLTVNISSVDFPSCTAEMDSHQPESGTQLWINLNLDQAISGFFAFNFYNSDTGKKLGTSYNTHDSATTTAEAIADALEGFDIAEMISLVSAGKLQLQVQWFAPPDVVSIREVNLEIASSEKMTVAPTTTPPTPEVPEGFCFYMDHGSPRLKWDAPTDMTLNDGETLRYKIYLKPEGSNEWKLEGGTSQTFLPWPADKAGIYQVKVEAVTRNSDQNQTERVLATYGESTEDSLTLTVTAQSGSPISPPTYVKNEEETTEEYDTYNITFVGLTPNTYFKFNLKSQDGNPSSGFGSQSDSDGKDTGTIGGSHLTEDLATGQYLVLEYSDAQIGEGGKTCSYTVTQRGDWAPCTPSAKS